MIVDEKTFIDLVRKWVKNDDSIRQANLELRKKKEEKKEMEKEILAFMKKTDQDVLNISSGGTLRMTVSKTKGSLKEEYLRNILGRFTANPDEASAMVDTILRDRPLTERVYLKRSQPRAKK